jgi:large subunit ribosomal protein L15
VHLHDLHSPEGARKKANRVGRGTGSGRGKTSGRGQKGQRARGQGFRLGFEGGQMPLAKRIPKLPGFTNRFKTVYAPVNLTKLNRFEDGSEVGPEVFAELGFVDDRLPVKILGTGHLQRRLTVSAHAASERARNAIEARGGTLRLLGGEAPAEGSEPTTDGEAPSDA